MMLTTKVRYAVMAILDMVSRGGEKPTRLAEIAKRQEIDLRYLEQIFAKLKKAKLVSSVRGPGGGYLLNCTHDELSVYDIVMAVEENVEMTRCKNSPTGCLLNSEKCASHHLWNGLSIKIKKYLSHITIKDVITNNM